MKSLLTFSTIISLLFTTLISFAQDEPEYPPYYLVAEMELDMEKVVLKAEKALTDAGFEIVGKYHPGANDSLYVICYSRRDLQDITLEFKDRGALASVLKVGFLQKKDHVDVSMLNPLYLFYAYLLDGIESYLPVLTRIDGDAVKAMKNLGEDFEAFGGALTAEDLVKYRYKMMMPYFTDPEELNEFESFEAGLEIIQKNLNAGKGNTVKVYEIIFEDKKVAVWGIGLMDAEEGESHFLPIIGESHVCAMPYEMILTDKTLTMLRGRYRIALHWPELTMGTFMKIMSTPGNIEDFLEGLSE